MIYTYNAPLSRYVFLAIAMSLLFSRPFASASPASPEAVPAIDQAAPSSYETATFGLG